MTISTDRCVSRSWRPQYKLKIRGCSRRSPTQVKFAVEKGYNQGSIVMPLIAKEPNCTVNRNEKKCYLYWNYECVKEKFWAISNTIAPMSLGAIAQMVQTSSNLQLCKRCKCHAITPMTCKSYILGCNPCVL